MFQIKFAEKIETNISCSIIVFENRAVYETMWEKKFFLEPGRSQATISRMRIACWIPTALRISNTNAFHCNNGCTNAPQY